MTADRHNRIAKVKTRVVYRIFVLLFLAALLFWPSGLIPPHPQKMHLTVWLFFIFEGCALAGFIGGGLMLAADPAAKKAAQVMLLTAFVAYSAAQITARSGACWVGCHLYVEPAAFSVGGDLAVLRGLAASGVA